MAEPSSFATLADYMQYMGMTLPSRGLPSGDLSRDGRRAADEDLQPRSVWGALTPQSEEERQSLHPRNVLPWMAWTLPPVNAYVGGQRLAQGIGEGDPLAALLGAGQIGGSLLWPAPGMTTLPAPVTSRLPPILGGSGATRAPPATTGQELLQDLERANALMGVGRIGTSSRPPPGVRPETPPPPPPRAPPTAGQRDFAALQPGAAFPRIEGTTAEDARNAYLALREVAATRHQYPGGYDAAIGWLGGRHPGAESLLRAWQARGVDAGQALRYWQGLAGLRDLERPTRLNALAPFGVGAGGLGLAGADRPTE